MRPRLPDRWDLGLSGEIETPDAPVVSDCGGIFHLGTVCFSGLEHPRIGVTRRMAMPTSKRSAGGQRSSRTAVSRRRPP